MTCRCRSPPRAGRSPVRRSRAPPDSDVHYVHYVRMKASGGGRPGPGEGPAFRYTMNHVDVPVPEARAQFADLVNRVAYTGEPVRLTRRGKVMAALVSPEDLELLEQLRSQHVPLTQMGQQPAPQQPERTASGPLRIAAEYRPPGFGR